MAVLTSLMVFAGLFACVAAGFALSARHSARAYGVETRRIHSQLVALDLDIGRHDVAIRRLTSSVGALGRWSSRSEPEPTPDGLPDPKKDPEAWRSAVRRMGEHQKTKPKGELQ
jgi:hypothetical protein